MSGGPEVFVDNAASKAGIRPNRHRRDPLEDWQERIRMLLVDYVKNPGYAAKTDLLEFLCTCISAKGREETLNALDAAVETSVRFAEEIAVALKRDLPGYISKEKETQTLIEGLIALAEETSASFRKVAEQIPERQTKMPDHDTPRDYRDPDSLIGERINDVRVTVTWDKDCWWGMDEVKDLKSYLSDKAESYSFTTMPKLVKKQFGKTEQELSKHFTKLVVQDKDILIEVEIEGIGVRETLLAHDTVAEIKRRIGRRDDDGN